MVATHASEKCQASQPAGGRESRDHATGIGVTDDPIDDRPDAANANGRRVICPAAVVFAAR